MAEFRPKSRNSAILPNFGVGRHKKSSVGRSPIPIHLIYVIERSMALWTRPRHEGPLNLELILKNLPALGCPRKLFISDLNYKCCRVSLTSNKELNQSNWDQIWSIDVAIVLTETTVEIAHWRPKRSGKPILNHWHLPTNLILWSKNAQNFVI